MQKSCKDKQVDYSPTAIAADTRTMLLLAAGPMGWNDNKKSAIARAARYCGIAYSRAFNIIYGRSKRIEASEFLRIKAAVERLELLNERNQAMVMEINRTLSHLERKPAHEHKHLALGPGKGDC